MEQKFKKEKYLEREKKNWEWEDWNLEWEKELKDEAEDMAPIMIQAVLLEEEGKS